MPQSHNHYPYPPDYHEHDDGYDVSGHTHTDGDTWHEHTEPPVPLKAERLSEKESMEIEAAEQKAEQEKLTAKRLEELKTSKWTVDDLKALLFDVGNNNGYNYLNGADIKNLQTMQIEAQKGILDKCYGDPVELQTDLSMLEEVEAHDDIVIIKNGKREKKEKLPPQVLDSLYAMVITNHILGQNFILTVDKDRQPHVTDNENSPDPKRQADRQAQAKNLETTLRQKNNGDTPLIREWQGDKITKPDGSGSRIIPKINTYITTGAFLAMNMPDIGSHDNLLKTKFNAGSGEKNLHEYRNTLLGKMAGKVDEKSIKESSLTAGEKSFLLAWKNENDDGIFSGIRDRQAAGFLNILSNPTYKTVEQKGAENSKNFISNNYGKLILGGIGIVAFIGGLSMLFGPKSKLWQRILGGFMALSVGAFGAKTIDSLIDKTGLYEKKIKKANGTPTEATGVLNTTTEGAKDLWTNTKTGIQNFQARIAGPNEWTLLMMRDDIGPQITNYPAGALMYALYDGYPTEQGEFASYEKNPKMGEIKGTLKKMSEAEKIQLRGLMQNSWDRQRELDPTKVADDITKDNSHVDKLTLGKMIKDIDDCDQWWNTLPDWVGFKDGLFNQRTQKTEMLKVIADKPADWGDLTLEQFDNHFLKVPQVPDPQIQAYLLAFTAAYPTYNPPAFDVLKTYFESLTIPTTVDKRTTKFRDFLKKT